MLPIVLTSVAWYTIPKGITYLTAWQYQPESKIDRIRAKLYDCKCGFINLVYPNSLTRFTYEALQIPYTHLWLSAWIVPGMKKVLPFALPGDRFLQMAVCYALFTSKYMLKRFIKSPEGIEWVASKWGLRILSTGIGLGLIEKALTESIWASSRDDVLWMILVLQQRLKPSDAYDFLRARGEEALLSVVDRVKAYASEEVVGNLSQIIDNRFPPRFGIVEENEDEDERLETMLGISRGTFRWVANTMRNASILDNVSTHMIFNRPPSVRDYLFAYRSWFLRGFRSEEIVVHLPDYPEDIHDTDPILSKIQCPILHRPLRSAVIDPTNQKTIYDREAFAKYLTCNRVSPMTKRVISESFDANRERGSKYDTILRYRKACLRLKKLEDPEEFMTNLKLVFAEVCSLENASSLKEASERVRDFFQVGFLSAYDIRGLEYDWVQVRSLRASGLPEQAPYDHEACRREHNQRQNRRDEGTNFGVRKWIRPAGDRLTNEDFDQPGKRKPGNPLEPLIENFDQYRFIVEEVNREMQNMKTHKEELIEAFS